MPDDAVELAATEAVFKFYPPPEAFVPTGQNLQNGNLFIPSSTDKEDAKKRGTNVRLTVWDLALTTFEQAKKIYGQQRDLVAYGLAVADVLALLALPLLVSHS